MTLGSRARSALSLNGLLAERMGWSPASPGSLAIAVGLVCVAAGVRLLVSPWVTGMHFVTFPPAIILATLMCGPVAGITAAALSAITTVWIIGPGLASSEEAVSLGLFIAVASLDIAVVSCLLAVIKARKAALDDIAALNTDLRRGETFFRDLLESAPDAMLLVDAEDRIVRANEQAAALFGYSAAEMQGNPVEMLMPVRLREKHPDLFRRFAADPKVRPMGVGLDLRGLKACGVEFPVDVKLSPMQPAGRHMIIAVIRDVTDQRLAEARQDLMVHELNHRVKNTLSIVQSIMHLTSKFTETRAEFEAALTGRLHALARSHDVLTRSDWVQAGVREVLAEQAAPFEIAAVPHIHLDGPDVSIAPQTAISLGLAIGELITNAAKYGALSTPDGSVNIDWTVETAAGAPRLRLIWRETGGPQVQPPERRGFGTVMIERSLSHTLGGSARMSFEPAGLRCEIELPISRPEEGT